MSLIVLEPGLETRIVDLGRPGTRSLGVPVGGAADRRSLILGNALLGNPDGAAALEFTLKGPRLRAESDIGCVVVGAPFDVRRDGYAIEIGRTFTIRSGEELRIGGTGIGVRAYLCLRGGIDVPAVLGSRSTLATLKQGAKLPCAGGYIHSRFCDTQKQPSLVFPDEATVAVLPGLQARWFSESEFFGQPFTVTPASNRMGLRLQGKPLTMSKREMVSEAVCPGSVQVTNDGQCIVLGVDGQTIGGYPKIAQVIQADLDALGQLRPGQMIEFKKVTLDEAIERNRQAQAELREWTMRLRLSLDAIGVARK